MKTIWLFSASFMFVLVGLLLNTKTVVQDNSDVLVGMNLPQERLPASLDLEEKKKINGLKCSSHKECLSNSCSQQNLCLPSKMNPSDVGEFCVSHSGCKSQVCDARYRQCRGPAGRGN